MQESVREKLHKILDLVLDINESGKATTFFRFSWHVNDIDIQAYLPKWKPDAYPDLWESVYIDRPNSPGCYATTIDRAIEQFEKVKKGEYKNETV